MKPVPTDADSDEVDGLVGAVADHEGFLRSLVGFIPRLLDVAGASLLLEQPESGRLLFHLATGVDGESIQELELEKGEGIAGWVVRTGEPTLAADAAHDPRWSPKIARRLGVTPRSIAAAPLIVDEKTIGVLEAVDRNDGQAMTEKDLDQLVALAHLVAMTLEKSRALVKAASKIAKLQEELFLTRPIVGNSVAIQEAIQTSLKAAASRSTVLITGASGVGKELFARLIHERSDRANAPLITINCGALPETLLERELFGHERGAFTGADRASPGLFTAADGGSIFLDEIGETTPAMQVKLLRVLQEGTFTPLGGQKPVTVDVRVIAATNRPLETQVEEGDFREDLFYRLNVLRIHLPSLAERPEDIPLLAEAFLDTLRKERKIPGLRLAPATLEALVAYPWPGNVRQLHNAVERGVIMAEEETIKPYDLPPEVVDNRPPSPADAVGKLALPEGVTLKEAQLSFKRVFVADALRRHKGNRSKTALALGVQRTYLSRLIKELGIGKE